MSTTQTCHGVQETALAAQDDFFIVPLVHMPASALKRAVAALVERQECSCQHHNWLTCLAEKTGMSRFNAKMIFAYGTEEGRCSCPCHQDANNQQISEKSWKRRMSRRQKVVSA